LLADAELSQTYLRELTGLRAVSFLEQALAREESIDVLYQARGRSTPEYRHLTPFLVEQRGPRYYLIAYCHTRRANRTFRLDRLRLIDHPPEL
jgi:predicted DNA-binding transcriptional regulator YafY